ncbi:GPO family capsid scaffolding protein [Novosphingobium humi]|uniref:GPO family capsid scaffolding protein n=1 Tax=Novosphingobium humi TaxID=2282397 RepID=A0ABY7TTG6_9SPHN|nr:GPO family capsid scaffolding protein [Novosphingobium humi]WCT76281.1 GPO family capsid scaffolding protein [Novosphingobium humi]
MKTKPFLLATAGSTVDGRTIEARDLEQMASSYNPKTYGARVNIEHIRGVSGQAPFNAYGDVLELSVGEVDVDFNGKPEKRKALFGVLDVTDNAKALNDANQKVYPSIEIIDNFAGKGFSYLGGVALTDSPAAIATDRLKFNRTLPGSISLAGDTAAALEFAEDGAATESAKGLLASMSAMFDKFTASFAPAPKPETQPEPKPEGQQPTTLDFSALRGVFEEFGQTVTTAIDGLRSEFRTEADAMALKLKKLEDTQEATPAPHFQRRPIADGNTATAIEKAVF